VAHKKEYLLKQQRKKQFLGVLAISFARFWLTGT
jgi:hypothetical protein